MKNFWPHRPDPKGFSIENLPHRYLEKNNSGSSNKISNHLIVDRNLESINEDSKEIWISYFPGKRGHWANRDFSEYRNAA